MNIQPTFDQLTIRLNGFKTRWRLVSRRTDHFTGAQAPHKLTAEALRIALDDGTDRPCRRFETKSLIDSPHATNDPTYTIVAVLLKQLQRKAATMRMCFIELLMQMPGQNQKLC